MTTEKDPQIAAKLHPIHDKDLIENIKAVPKRERSYIYRQALREYFQKKIENNK